MAQKIVVELIDDIDGKAADETVTFSLDGTSYEIDLTSKNADKFRGLFMDYVAAGRKVGKSPRRGGKAAASGPSASEVRDWARANGYEVTDRGRVAASIREAYDAAH